MQLDHINIRAPGELLEEVKDFYCGLFGLEDGFRPDFGQAGYWLYSEDRPVVHLSEDGARQADTRRGYLDHVAFRSNDLPGLVARLEARGVAFRSTRIAELGMTQLFFSDPAGTGLEVNFLDGGS